MDELAASQMHPSQPKISDWTHAQMLVAANSKHPLRRGNRRANFREVQGSIVVSGEHFFESGDDCCVPTDAQLHFFRRIPVETYDQRVQERVLQSPRRFGLRENVG